MLIALGFIGGLAALVVILTAWVMYNDRQFPHQIRFDANAKLAELEAAFAAASQIVAATTSAPQQKAAQEILDGLASDNIRQTKEYLAKPEWTYLAKSQAHTGMLNVQAAVRFLAHDTTGKFIGIPGEVSPAVRKLLEDSMKPVTWA